MTTKMMMAGLMVLLAASHVRAQRYDGCAHIRDAKMVESQALAGDIPPASDPCCVVVPGIPCPKDVPVC